VIAAALGGQIGPGWRWLQTWVAGWA